MFQSPWQRRRECSDWTQQNEFDQMMPWAHRWLVPPSGDRIGCCCGGRVIILLASSCSLFLLEKHRGHHCHRCRRL